MLQVSNLSISFGGHRAVADVSYSFRPGELTAVVGPNGAGKTTLFNLISGQLFPSEGTVALDGKNITRLSAAVRTNLGIGRSFQLTSLFPELSVRENVRLALQARAGEGINMMHLASTNQQTAQDTMNVLTRCKLEQYADLVASSLAHGEHRKLEVAMLVARDPQVFMFDEPTAGMSQDEVPDIIDLIGQIKHASPDRIFLLVEHKVDVIHALADRIMVLHEGKLVADGTPAEVMDSDIVKSVYLGTLAES